MLYKISEPNIRGVAMGVYIPPKLVQVKLSWGKNDVRTIGVGAQSTLGGHKIFARKICIKNQQNARILHDSCLKNYQNTRIMIFARKI